MTYQPGLHSINEIISLSDELEGMRKGSNSFNIDDLAAWLDKAGQIKALAEDTKNYMIELQEYKGEVDNGLHQEQFNHEREYAI